METFNAQPFGTQSIGLPVAQNSNSLETDFLKKVTELNDTTNKFTEKNISNIYNGPSP